MASARSRAPQTAAAAADESETRVLANADVTFVCVEDEHQRGRVRVRIQSAGYMPGANCQCERALRVRGRVLAAPSSAVHLVETATGRFFYRVDKGALRVVADGAGTGSGSGAETASADAAASAGVKRPRGPSERVHVRVFGDEDADPTCVLCLDAKRGVVFVPCGHFVACAACASTITDGPSHARKCPICRRAGVRAVPRELVD